MDMAMPDDTPIPDDTPRPRDTTIPDAFYEISNTFHQDTHLIYKTLDEAIRASIKYLTQEERQIAKNYLDELLSGKYNDEQLAAIWEKTDAGSGGFGITRGNEGDAAGFLSLIRAALDS
jgi:hypothetical protein